MFDNYFNLQPPKHNDEDLHNLLFKQLITEAFIDNESQFDKILDSLNKKNVSLFETFTMYPEYSGSKDGNDISIERSESDYGDFLAASIHFIKDEKYLIKLVNNIKKEDVQKNGASFTAFMIGLLDSNFKTAFSQIINNDLLTEKEIKLKLILPENLLHYGNRKVKFHNLEIDFLSKNIHELNITNKNSYRVAEIYEDVLSHVNSEQYKSISEIIMNKVDFSILEGYNKKELFKTFLEFGIIQPNQIVGQTNLLEDPQIEIKSFLNLGEHGIEQIIKLQANHLEQRLQKSNKPNPIKEKTKKI